MAGVVLLSASVLAAGVATMQPSASAVAQLSATNTEASVPAVTAPNAVMVRTGHEGANMPKSAAVGPNASAKLVPTNSGELVAPVAQTTIVVQPTGSRLYGFDTTPGIAAPPGTLGSYVMTPFGPDPQPLSTDITSIAGPCPIGGSIAFSAPMSHRRITQGWMTWSHGYMGDVYYNYAVQDVQVTLPTPSCAIYFYIEPDPFTPAHTFTITANDGTSTTFSALGSSGAAYCGIFGPGLSSFTIHDNDSVGYAIGEFGLGCICEPLFKACCLEAVEPVSCIDSYDVMACIAEGGRWSIDAALCTELVPPCGQFLGACCYGPEADPGYEPYQCIGDMVQWECLYLSEYTNWSGGESCSDPFFLCPGTPTYCDASGGCDEYIARVQINEIDNSSGCDQYADYTTMFTTVLYGMEYPITVTNGTPYSADTCSIWVDWNQDKTFEDAAPELIGDALGGGTTPPYSLTLTVPAGGTPGYTRMRIRIDYNNPDLDPCGATTYGEVEDYSLLVVYGGTGACCNIYTGACNDDVEALVCMDSGSQWRWYYEQGCSELNPTCGDPGACCDDETAVCVETFRILCTTRFVSGALCIPDPFTPACGDWQPTGLLYAPSEPDNATFRAAVAAILNSPVDYFDAMTGTPTQEIMAPYACVFTWCDYPYASAVGMGDVLADYADLAGRVILGQWCKHSDARNWLDGRIMTSAYCPVSGSSTSFGSGSYGEDGMFCWHQLVSAYDTGYLDVITAIEPVAMSDGTIAGSPSVVFRNDGMKVFYSAGNTGATYGGGDWARLTANMVICGFEPAYGACCDRETYAVPGDPWAGGVCEDHVLAQDCGAIHGKFYFEQQCSELPTTCGDPGACCDDPTQVCEVVLQALCNVRFAVGTSCEELNPACGEWIPVGLLYCPSEPDNATFRASVAGFLGQPVEYFDARSGTPTLEYLSGFASAMTWCNYAYANNTAMGDVLADFVDMGGVTILGQWCKQIDASNYLSGRIMTPDYCPVTAGLTSFGSGSYAGDGTMCPHIGVTAYDTGFLDEITGIVAGSFVDGTIAGYPAVIWRPEANVFYSPGNTGTDAGSGDWALLTSNMLQLCGGPIFGACCMAEEYAVPGDPWAGGVCNDDVAASDCIAVGGQFRYNQECAGLTPICGNPGACCDDETVVCEVVLQALCNTRFAAGTSCDELNPLCGDWRPVGLLYAPSEADNAAFRTEVSALIGAPVEYFNAINGTPALADLASYAAAMTWVNYPLADNVAMGNVLAEFKDMGGRVILGQWCFQSDAGNYLSGMIMTAAYCPVTSVSTSFGSGAYGGDGTLCPHAGIYGTVTAYDTGYLDVITGTAPDAMVDGTFIPTGSPSVVFWPDMSVFYSAGNTGMLAGSGDWVLLTANMVDCSGEPGACCNIYTAECLYPVEILDCLAMGAGWQTHPNKTCEELVPPCGNPGACCDIYTGLCNDGVLQANCTGGRFEVSAQCDEMDPVCGTPGCCCDRPESGELTDPHFAFEANCVGRFIPGALPVCGDLDMDGDTDMDDYNLFLDAFGTQAGQPGWLAAADMDGDGTVTLIDFQTWRQCYEYAGAGCSADDFEPPCGMQQISFDTSPGMGAPPADLCGVLATPFPLDPRPTLTDVSDLPIPCTIPGLITFATPVNHRRIGSGWMSWSHEYMGDVYYSNGAFNTTMNMPSGTVGVYFYVEPNHFVDHTFTVLVNGTVLSPEFMANGSGGAAYIGICGTPASPIDTLLVTCITSDDFAFGEFGIVCQDVPGACCNEPTGVCNDDVMGSVCAVIPGFRFVPWGTCDELNPPCGEIRGACCNETECSFVKPSECGGVYEGDGIPCDPNPCLCADFFVDGPGQWLGTTVGAVDDCNLRAGEDVIYAVNIPTAGDWQFNLCGTTWDTYMFIGYECCTQFISNDDGCPTGAYAASILTLTGIAPGTYYVDIEPFGATYTGPYTFNVIQLATGACCNDAIGQCTDGVQSTSCLSPLRFAADTACVDLVPACTGPIGACCDDVAVICVDDVYLPACSTRFVADGQCVELDPPCGELMCYDYTVTAPVTGLTGNTCGAVDSCVLRPGEDIIYKVTIPTDGNWKFELCGTAWDTYMFIGYDCCTQFISNDDACGGTTASDITLTGITAGDYYVDIEPYNASVCGVYQFAVTSVGDRDDAGAAPVAPAKLEELMPAMLD